MAAGEQGRAPRRRLRLPDGAGGALRADGVVPAPERSAPARERAAWPARGVL